MTTIGDLMRSLIGIFNEHAGADKLLSKAELKNMMNQSFLRCSTRNKLRSSWISLTRTVTDQLPSRNSSARWRSFAICSTTPMLILLTFG
ncbi:unnamed protein product [Oikopleura dioica]|uniref:S100/CaBP-9k-type calcium binding subdomain domain-containing protein n=1 Tax=Oikopleura dioica TaxID=34765 RepID=E4XQT2_OIKDI|nr:unnamed protein product [Oikopleura dioica]